MASESDETSVAEGCDPTEIDANDDDDDVMAAAEQWASHHRDADGPTMSERGGAKDNEKLSEISAAKRDRKSKSTSVGNDPRPAETFSSDRKGGYVAPRAPQTLSMHLTRVPFDASQGGIRQAFSEVGCKVTSVRLVYDHDFKTREKTFRGVAFVDVADETSFRRGLEFHNKAFLGQGKRVNVRPTRTKKELSDIVRLTEERVANLIARTKTASQSGESQQVDGNDNKGGKSGPGGGGSSTNKRKSHKMSSQSGESQQVNDSDKNGPGGGGSTKKQRKPNKKSPESEKSQSRVQQNKFGRKAATEQMQGKSDKNLPPSSLKKERPAKAKKSKLNKKERAKKAAVIRMKKMKKG